MGRKKTLEEILENIKLKEQKIIELRNEIKNLQTEMKITIADEVLEKAQEKGIPYTEIIDSIAQDDRKQAEFKKLTEFKADPIQENKQNIKSLEEKNENDK